MVYNTQLSVFVITPEKIHNIGDVMTKTVKIEY